jgi:hypothetical protein
LKDKFKNLEENYFKLEKMRAKKYEELEQLLRQKEEEKSVLIKISNIYTKQEIEDLDYYKLKEYESKILKSLKAIKERKTKCTFNINI